MTIAQLQKAYDCFKQLQIIAHRLHKQDKNACNYGLTPRQEKMVKKLENDAENWAQRLGFHAYHQGDPRGATLYLVEKLEVANTNYHNGVCIY